MQAVATEVRKEKEDKVEKKHFTIDSRDGEKVYLKQYSSESYRRQLKQKVHVQVHPCLYNPVGFFGARL